jgi:hypothetical protein
MSAPIIVMQGRIEDIVKASLQDRMYAKIIPARKAAKRFTQIAVFSETPCWNKSTDKDDMQ